MKLFLILVFCYLVAGGPQKLPKERGETKLSPRFQNPNFIRDRHKRLIYKPFFNATWENRFTKPFSPSYMDYCDPYHCNMYNRLACGLNRKTMRFKWFKSGCHMILSNMCSYYRGSLKYDMVAQKFCVRYIMLLRNGCPSSCVDEELSPLCGMSSVDNHVVLFKNRCSMDMVNCRNGILDEYDEVRMDVCEYYL